VKRSQLGHPMFTNSFVKMLVPIQTKHTTTWNILLLVANSHHNCIKCTTADVRLRTPDDVFLDAANLAEVFPLFFPQL